MRLLCSESFEVYLKTSAALFFAQVDRRVSTVLDLKRPAPVSPTGSNGLIRADFRGGSDQICDERAYVWVKARMLEGNLN